ncbi:MAG: GNAT family N-acetyltransferase [Lautropia sp.]
MNTGDPVRADGACLVLREFETGDRDALVAMHADPRLRRHLVDDYPLDDPAVAQRFLARLGTYYRAHEGLGIWHTSVQRSSAASFVGWHSLMPMVGRPGAVEIGCRLVPAAWGSGLALEGGERLLDRALERLGLETVWGVCHPANRSAQAALLALGFEPMGLLPYDGQAALHFRIRLNAWRALRDLPRRTRLRRALRAIAAARPAGPPSEEPIR